MLCLLSDASLESLALNALLKQLHLVLIVGLYRVHHQTTLHLLLHLVLLVFTFLLQKLVLLEFASKFVDFLAEEYLLCVPLVVERFLVREELLLELLLADSLDAGLSLETFLNMSVLVSLLLLSGLELELVLTVESLELLFLSQNTTVGLL